MSQSKILEIGDTHGEAEQVVDDILENYDAGDIDGVAFVGDATNMPGKYVAEEDVSEGLSRLVSQNVLDEDYSHFDRLGEELDVPIYSLPGNHEEGFRDLYEQVVDSYENVQDISYDSVEIGDETIVGFDSHQNREKPVEGFDSDGEEGVEEPEAEEYPENSGGSEATPSDLVTGPARAMGTMVGSMFGLGGSSSNELTLDEEQEDEEYEEESEGESEEEDPQRQMYEQKYGGIDEVLTEADDDAILLHHSVPDGAELEGTEMGLVNEEVGYKGSVVGTEMIEKHGISTYLGGHMHGQAHEEILGADVYNPGADNYYELAVEDGKVTDSDHHDTGIWEPDYGEQIDRVLEGSYQHLPDDIVEQVDDGEITVREAFEMAEERMRQEGPQAPPQPQQAAGAGQAGA